MEITKKMRLTIRFHGSFLRILANLVIIMVIFPPFGLTQSFWLGLDHDKYFTIEIFKPYFDAEDNTSFKNYSMFFSLRLPIGKDVLITGELPFAKGDLLGDSNLSVTAGQSLGNPYLGIEIRSQGSPVHLEVGFRIPIIRNERRSDWITGLFSDIDRSEAFAPNIISGQAILNHEHKDAKGKFFRARLGPILWINEKTRENDMFLSYGFQLGYELNKVILRGGFTGRAILSEKNLGLGERTVHQLGVALQYTFGYVTPGLHIKIPLDNDLTQVLDYVLSLNVKFLLR